MHKKEVASMLDWEYDDELAKKVQRQEAYEEGYAEAYTDALEIGKKKQILEMIRNMLRANRPISEIAQFVGLSEEKISRLIKDV